MLEDFDELPAFLGRLRELSETATVVKNWRTRRRAKRRNMVLGESELIAIPPRRLPRAPAEAKDINAKDCSWPDTDGDCNCLPASATMASLATSAIDAPRFPRRRKRVRMAIVMDSGRRTIANHETACNRAAHDSINGVPSEDYRKGTRHNTKTTSISMSQVDLLF